MALSPGVRAILPGAKPTKILRQNFPIDAAGIVGWFDDGVDLARSLQNRVAKAAPASQIGTIGVAESYVSLTTGTHQILTDLADTPAQLVAMVVRVLSDTQTTATKAIIASNLDTASPNPGSRLYTYAPNTLYFGWSEINNGAAVSARLGHSAAVDLTKWRVILAGHDAAGSVIFEDYTASVFKTATMTYPRLFSAVPWYFGQRAGGGYAGLFDLSNGVIMSRLPAAAERKILAEWLAARAAFKGLTLG
jgi:hypothetical protein